MGYPTLNPTLVPSTPPSRLRPLRLPLPRGVRNILCPSVFQMAYPTTLCPDPALGDMRMRTATEQ